MADLADPNRYADLAERNKQAREQVAVKALIRDEQDRLLLVTSAYKPCWDLPGGMVEANEPLPEAVRRELCEELSG